MNLIQALALSPCRLQVEKMARQFGVQEDVAYTCETAGHFWLLHVLSRLVAAGCGGNKAFVQVFLRKLGWCGRQGIHLGLLQLIYLTIGMQGIRPAPW
jgi:hypothetical protein